jgi:hypothetical protein
MNDDQIIEYLRSRSRTAPPPDAIHTVMAAVESASAPRSWFAPFVPAAAAVAAAAALLVLALLIGQRPDIGPAPTGSEQPTPSATEMPSTSPTPSPLSLLAPGAVAEIPALDSSGQWGTIRVERGEDLGGYSDADVDREMFVIEFFVSYTADRMPDPAQFGSSDWALRPTDPNAEHFFLVEPRVFERADGFGSRPDTPLGIYPGAIDIFTTPTEGTIAFTVPRREANLALELVYRAGTGDEVAIPARDPGPPPDPVTVPTPTPGPGVPRYIDVEGAPFPVLESGEADALFARPDECANPEASYTLTFPDDWYTNTETGDVAACSWFTPEFFEVSAPGVAPDEVWIGIGVVDGVVGYTSLTPVFYNEPVTVGGRDGRRAEYNPDPNSEPDYRAYHYVVPLGENGPTLVAATNSTAAGDYRLAKAVLDRIMASFAFDN